MWEQTQDVGEVIARVAALDIGKAELVCCVRLPAADGSGPRLQEVTTYSTMTRQLQVMADRLRTLGVTRVVIRSTRYRVRSRNSRNAESGTNRGRLRGFVLPVGGVGQVGVPAPVVVGEVVVEYPGADLE